MSTKVLACDCKSGFQDREYAPGFRLHNTNDAQLVGLCVATCTVCGKEKRGAETLRTREFVTKERFGD